MWTYFIPQILILVVIQHGKQDPLCFRPQKEILEDHHKETLSAYLKKKKKQNHNDNFLLKRDAQTKKKWYKLQVLA